MTRPRNDTFLRALLREPTPYTPIWIMRQAGRYLPEYNRSRARTGSFLDLCRNPAMATEVTLQPLERFALDAAIVFSDILTIPDAMGLGLHFVEGEGPRFERPLTDEQAVRDLQAPDPSGSLAYVLETVAQVRKALSDRVPLIGFAGSPFTLACYMVEGRSGTGPWGQFLETVSWWGRKRVRTARTNTSRPCRPCRRRPGRRQLPPSPPEFPRRAPRS